MNAEKTLVIIKPDAVKRALIGKIIERIENKGLKIVAAKMQWLNKEILEKHYEMHKDKPFFNSLVSFMSSGPCLLMVVEGPNAISILRLLAGKTNAAEALPGTIRGDYALSIQNNVIHASDSKESAEREISLFFKPEEIFNYKRADEDLVYGNE